ncbi:hypothetical protein PVAG01_04943 [Phlyctema vagabunda]|uniref:Uncharacterized protein n=1 Tax=Phlyctema vagabunda TaxID=108571 RepID=A0ABR4PIM7_9HELO
MSEADLSDKLTDDEHLYALRYMPSGSLAALLDHEGLDYSDNSNQDLDGTTFDYEGIEIAGQQLVDETYTGAINQPAVGASAPGASVPASSNTISSLSGQSASIGPITVGSTPGNILPGGSTTVPYQGPYLGPRRTRTTCVWDIDEHGVPYNRLPPTHSQPPTSQHPNSHPSSLPPPTLQHASRPLSQQQSSSEPPSSQPPSSQPHSPSPTGAQPSALTRSANASQRSGVSQDPAANMDNQIAPADSTPSASPLKRQRSNSANASHSNASQPTEEPATGSITRTRHPRATRASSRIAGRGLNADEDMPDLPAIQTPTPRRATQPVRPTVIFRDYTAGLRPINVSDVQQSGQAVGTQDRPPQPRPVARGIARDGATRYPVYEEHNESVARPSNKTAGQGSVGTTGSSRVQSRSQQNPGQKMYQFGGETNIAGQMRADTAGSSSVQSFSPQNSGQNVYQFGSGANIAGQGGADNAGSSRVQSRSQQNPGQAMYQFGSAENTGSTRRASSGRSSYAYDRELEAYERELKRCMDLNLPMDMAPPHPSTRRTAQAPRSSSNDQSRGFSNDSASQSYSDFDFSYQNQPGSLSLPGPSQSARNTEDQGFAQGLPVREDLHSSSPGQFNTASEEQSQDLWDFSLSDYDDCDPDDWTPDVLDNLDPSIIDVLDPALTKDWKKKESGPQQARSTTPLGEPPAVTWSDEVAQMVDGFRIWNPPVLPSSVQPQPQPDDEDLRARARKQDLMACIAAVSNNFQTNIFRPKTPEGGWKAYHADYARRKKEALERKKRGEEEEE